MRNPRILWASPFHLLDSTSGASVAIHTILKQLHKFGWETYAISSTVFDDPTGGKLITKNIANRKIEAKVIDISHGFMTHRTIRSNSTSRLEITAQNELDYYENFLGTLDLFRPDIIFLYGGYVLDILVCYEARSRGIPILFYLGNAYYLNGARVFDLADLIITDSHKTANLYRSKLNLQTIPIGAFIDPDQVVSETHDPKYITFINPELSKGASVVAALALSFKKSYPEQRFMVVQSRGKWIDSLKEAGYEPEDFTNVDVAENVSNMKLVYKITKILLAPSLAYESAGRVLVEAQMNGIPVIGSNIGGIPQMIGTGGVVLDPPEKASKDHKALLGDLDIEEWASAIGKLLSDQVEYDKLSSAAKESAQSQHSIDERTLNLIDVLKPLTDRRAGDKPFVRASYG